MFTPKTLAELRNLTEVGFGRRYTYTLWTIRKTAQVAADCHFGHSGSRAVSRSYIGSTSSLIGQ